MSELDSEAADVNEGRNSSSGENLVVTRSDWEALQSSIEWMRRRLEQTAIAATPRDDEPTAPLPSKPSALPRDTEVRQSEDERFHRLEGQFRSALKDRELATALSGRSLVAGATAQLMKLWRDELDVVEDQGEYRVTTRDGRDVAQLVSEGLSTPEFAHFCLPRTRGGVGAGDSSRPGLPTQEPDGPRTLGEIVVQRWQEAAAARGNVIGRPIGLRRNR